MSGSITTSPGTSMVSPGVRPPSLTTLQQLPSSPSIGALQPPGSPRSAFILHLNLSFCISAPRFRLRHHVGTSGLSGDRSDHSGLISVPHYSLGSAHSRDDFESTPMHSLTTPGHTGSGSVRSHASSAMQSRSCARAFMN